jgi:hypothetical protein
MKFLESRSDMVVTLNKGHNNPGKRILDALKAIDGSGR